MTKKKGYTPQENFYKKDAIKAATELRYGKEVIDAIRAAETDNEISRIMAAARNEVFK